MRTKLTAYGEAQLAQQRADKFMSLVGNLCFMFMFAAFLMVDMNVHQGMLQIISYMLIAFFVYAFAIGFRDETAKAKCFCQGKMWEEAK
jgi:hypothetical protein